MKKQILALVPFVFCVAAGLEATPITYFTELSGLNENPPNASPGFGEATVIYDADTHTMEVSAFFGDLIGTTTAAHIHCCTTPPANVGVATQTPSFIGFPLGVSSGTFSNVYDLTLASSWNASFITGNGGTTAGAEAALAQGLADGRSYFNIHTSSFGGGEIRGFLVQVPEPGTLGLVLLALGALAAARKRRA